jgi:hypothetical protein
MKLHKIIQEYFRKSRYTNVKEWWTATSCPYSQFTCTRIILQDTEPGLETALVMLHLLGATNTELIQVCKDHGDKVFWRMMVGCEVSAQELAIIGALRLDPERAKLVSQILAL